MTGHFLVRRLRLRNGGGWRPAIIITALVSVACTPQGRLVQPLNAPCLAESWSSGFTRTSGWTGADGAATIPLPGNRTLWLFGDTWIGPVIDGRHAEGSAMVNNTIAICPTQATAPSPDQFRFFWGERNGKPAAWSIPTQPEQWFWPASGGTICRGPDGRDRLLLFMARISRIDQSDSVWNFRGRGTTLLSISNPSEDPVRWQSVQTPISDIIPGGPDLTWGTATWLAPDQLLYIYGIDGTNTLNKQLLLARVPAADAETISAWQYRTREGGSGRSSEAAPIAENLTSEISIHLMKLNGRPRFVVIQSEPPLGAGIMARTAAAPEGPWSNPNKLYTCPEPATDSRMMIYSAKAHPELSPPGELLVSYSVNSTDFWDVAAHADKYRPRFVRIPLAAIEHAAK